MKGIFTRETISKGHSSMNSAFVSGYKAKSNSKDWSIKNGTFLSFSKNSKDI